MKKAITILSISLLTFAGMYTTNGQKLERKTGDNNLSGFVEKGTGKVVIPLIYDYASGFSEGLTAIRDRKMKWGILNENGDVIVPFRLEYGYVGDCHDGLLAVDDKDDFRKNGYINTKGELVIPLKYEEAYDFKGGTAIVKQNGQYYRINKKDKKLETLTEKEVKKIHPLWWAPFALPPSLPDTKADN